MAEFEQRFRQTWSRETSALFFTCSFRMISMLLYYFKVSFISLAFIALQRI
ncbi:unnamed protein product [Moneuplotes crassus]|uniref:Uncharacterized protein n=1 Tax=Euplotes crassus TaxID=5936 RepID=A0AAD1Y2S0_EUPCR|nr:unnamed protein product [Moneuplotes crassus]